MILSKLIINQVIKLLISKFKLDKIKDYVFKDNELDKTSKNHEDRIRILESLAHSPKNFKCKYKDKKEIKYG
jgi:hypothetical protein